MELMALRVVTMLCSILSGFASPCVVFVLVDNEILDPCSRRLLAHVAFAIARQDTHGYASDNVEETRDKSQIRVAGGGESGQ